MNYLSINLTNLRKQKKLTQEELAKKFYVTRQAVSKRERGESFPDVDTLVALSEFYSVSLEDLLKKEIKETNNVTTNEIDYKELKKNNRKKLVKSMIIIGVCVLATYTLICGIIFSSLVGTVLNIWLIWFTLPVVPPIIFAIIFRYEITRSYMMYFINIPFIAGLLYMVLHLYLNSESSWLVFLLIPVYYIIAGLVTFLTIIKK